MIFIAEPKFSAIAGGVGGRRHRLNIIAKLLREKRWRTPKGFYNHADVGQYFRAREQGRAVSRHARRYTSRDGHGSGAGQGAPLKSRSLGGALLPEGVRRNRARLQEVTSLLLTEESWLRQIESLLAAGNPSVSDALRDSVIARITRLREEQGSLQAESCARAA